MRKYNLKNSDAVVYQHPYNPCKTVKLDEGIHSKLGQIAKEKGTSRHAEMLQAIYKHVEKFFEARQ